MFKRLFSGLGKPKASAVPPHPGPDGDGVSRAIPKKIWDGPQGDFLRKIGASPDDASNLMPTQGSVQARHDELFREQTVFVADVNKKMQEGVNVIPWAMLPWNVWSGPHAEFLMVSCEKYPAGIWNMMLLPDDEAGARILNLPKHPGGNPPGLEGAANDMIGEIREYFSRVHKETGAAMAQGDTSALDKFTEAKDRTMWNVQRLALHLGAKTYGEETFNRHKVLFGEVLGWNIMED